MRAAFKAGFAHAGALNVNIAFKGASQRTIWESVISEFEAANPDVKVKTAFIEEEAYKVQLPAWLTTAPDIVKWHEGERMAYYASVGLFEDIFRRLDEEWLGQGFRVSKGARRPTRISSTRYRRIISAGACSTAIFRRRHQGRTEDLGMNSWMRAKS